MKKYILKYNFIILFLRIVALIFLIGLIVLLTQGLFLNKESFNNITLLLILCILIIFIAYRFAKRLLTESNYIVLNGDRITIYRLTTFKKIVVKAEDCVFFSSYRTPFESLILKLPSGQYIYLLSFDYFDFKKLPETFKKFGIEYEGYIMDITT
ncbi:hypothetical protein D3C80_1450360 [compost metagenome]